MTAQQTTKLTSLDQLQEGAWYALVRVNEGVPEFVAEQYAPLAEYVGDGDFADEDDHDFSFWAFDYAVLQGGMASSPR